MVLYLRITYVLEVGKNSASLVHTISACATVRGNPSRRNPLRHSGVSKCSSISSTTSPSLTSFPSSISFLIRLPRSEPDRTTARSMSPTTMHANNVHCVSKNVSTYFCSVLVKYESISIKTGRHDLEETLNKTMQKLHTSPKICASITLGNFWNLQILTFRTVCSRNLHVHALLVDGCKVIAS